MTFTPPDFSEILSKEQVMNSRLTNLRAKLMAGLTAAGITYNNNDSITQLIDKFEILPIFKTEANVNPADKLSTLYKLANITSASWQTFNNGKYSIDYTPDTTKDQFKEEDWYYAAAFGKLTTVPGSYYYGDNNGWRIESKFDISGGWNGWMGIGFMIDENYEKSGLVTDYNSSGYTGTFIGSVNGYIGVFSLDDRWGLPSVSVSNEDYPFAHGTFILEKGEDFELDYKFLDSNGNELMSGSWDPPGTWNSDEMMLGLYGSVGYKSNNYTQITLSETKIYYEPE